MSNYLLQQFTAYFEEIMPIKGRLLVTNSFITNFKEHLQKENKENRDLISAITTYRDLSALKATSNLFSPNFSYVLDINHLDEEIGVVISQHCCSAIAKAYEVFESYLLAILTEYLVQNQDMLVTLKLIEAKLILPKEEIRRILKKNQGTNNKALLSLVRKASPFFSQVETRCVLWQAAGFAMDASRLVQSQFPGGRTEYLPGSVTTVGADLSSPEASTR